MLLWLLAETLPSCHVDVSVRLPRASDARERKRESMHPNQKTQLAFYYLASKVVLCPLSELGFSSQRGSSENSWISLESRGGGLIRKETKLSSDAFLNV